MGRDFALGEDPNERIKKEILYDLVESLHTKGDLSADLMSLGSPTKVLSTLLDRDGGIRESRIMDLIEFGRIIHAEMSALSDAARLGLSVRQGILYCTTFPCHICAKHIVAAGVEKVLFLEPYPKSYAKELHADSIEVEGVQVIDKVKFEPFVGISPFRYRDFFERGRRKDRDGKVLKWRDGKPMPIIEIYNPVYTKIETILYSDLKPEIDTINKNVGN